MNNTSSLLSLRERFNADNILICVNGPISQSLIEEIGNALRDYLEVTEEHLSVATDVFGVYVEMAQNIRNYATRRGYEGVEAAATVVIAYQQPNRYRVSAGNPVEMEDGIAVKARVDALAQKDKAELKAAYKAQLRVPRESDVGAGLGLIEIARKACEPLDAVIDDLGGGRGFFTINAILQAGGAA